MKLLERYIFRRTLGALLLTLAALAATVWLTLALREFDLITARGQTLLTFLKLTSLIFPTMVMVIGPVAALVAVIYVLNQMNADSELAVMGAAGARPGITLRPVALVGIGLTAVVAVITLYVAPLAERSARDLLTSVNADIVNSVLREGTFMRVAKGLTINIKRRNPDRTIDGIFVEDARDTDQTVTYLARRGALLESPLGLFLVMQDGLIQRESPKSRETSMIEFANYAFDLSGLAASSKGPVTYQPSALPTSALFVPDPQDPIFQRTPGRFAAELYDRFSSPLYALIFSLVPLAFLGQARTTRQGRGAAVVGAIVVAGAVRGAGFLLAGTSATSPELLPFVPLVPIATILCSLAVILGLVRPSLPAPLLRAGEWVVDGVAKLAQRANQVETRG